MGMGLDQSLSCSKPIENTGRDTDGQGGGRKKKKKETMLPTKEGSEALDAGVEPDPSHVSVSHEGRTSLPSISLLVPSPGTPSCP